MLTLDILGSFHAQFRDGTVPNFQTDKARALLTYIVLNDATPPTRRALAELLWPDRPEKAAQSNLRKTLYRVRQALSNHAGLQIKTVGKTLQLDSAEITLDATRFKQLLAQTETHSHSDLASCPACIAALTEAADLYRGELLAGFNVTQAYSFDEWLTVEREYFHQLALTALHTLTQALLARHEWASAQRYAARQIGLEAWREGAHQQLMIALAQQGQPQAAIKQFQLCQAVLWDELGIEPSAELTTLADQIKSGQFVTSKPAQPIPTQPTKASHNLTTQTLPFFGRTAERQRLSHLLQDPVTRWVTLLGAGGVGKSRLSQQVGHSLLDHFADGVWFVPLAGLDGSSKLPEAAREQQIVTAIASAIGLTLRGADSAETQLINYLKDKHLLLILDNFEHVDEGAGIVNTLLQQVAQLAVLCTSRLPLQFRSEYCFQLDGLAVPAQPKRDETIDADRLNRWQTFASMQLYSDCAQRVTGRFALTPTNAPFVIQICRWVGGNALGIELAASWMRHKSAADIWADLQASYTSLQARLRDVPVRHRSMQTVFEGSWTLLDERERVALAQLSVFRGGFDLAAARAVVGADESLLFGLVEQSLLQQSNGRYGLHEALRQFSAEKLTTTDQTTQRHSQHFLEFLHACDLPLQRDTPQQQAAQIDHDFDNVRAAWTYALTTQAHQLLAKAVSPLSHYFQIRGRSLEAEQLFDEACSELRALADASTDAANFLMLMLVEQTRFLNRLALWEKSRQASAEAIALSQRLGDKASEEMARVWRAESLWRISRVDEALEHLYATSAEPDPAYPYVAAWRAHQLGIIYDIWEQDGHGEAMPMFESAAQIWDATRNLRGLAITSNSIAYLAHKGGDSELAEATLLKLLDLVAQVGEQHVLSTAYRNLGELALRRHDIAEAERYFQLGLAYCTETANGRGIAGVRQELGKLRAMQHKFAEAINYGRLALDWYRQAGNEAAVTSITTTLNEWQQAALDESDRVLAA